MSDHDSQSVPTTQGEREAWEKFRRNRYIDPSIDSPALRSAFMAGYAEAVNDLTTKAKHLADEWEPHPDGDIQFFVARLLEATP